MNREGLNIFQILIWHWFVIHPNPNEVNSFWNLLMINKKISNLINLYYEGFSNLPSFFSFTDIWINEKVFFSEKSILTRLAVNFGLPYCDSWSMLCHVIDMDTTWVGYHFLSKNTSQLLLWFQEARSASLDLIYV